ncbi:molecular chaperone TorD family protein [Halomicroarcula sp. F13]|uniref:Molecular chaperone TorD family protein n=2 Tax=Haloarcula rubra TaxID=2487747 RepID=A0AAW4PSL0_9EURY|nr:molecular chaperone TorD family protein [Halomicroarcula rubra]
MTDTDVDTTDPAFHSARAALYAATAGAFVYPDEETLRELQSEDAVEGIEQAADRLGLASEAARFTAALADADASDLQSTYTDLFGLPTDEGTYPVVPYEGNYTAGEEIDKQQRRIAAVVGLLETVGLEPSDSFGERQDHVVTELELLQVAAGQRAVVADRADDPSENEVATEIQGIEAAALANHLAPFVPAMAHDLRETTDCEVYLAAADLAESLVELDDAVHPDPPTRPDELSPPGVTAR